MSKPRLLVPVSLQFSVRYLLRSGLLNLIRDFADPVILLAWDDPRLEEELAGEGVETHKLIKAKWGGDYERARTTMNMRHQVLLNSPSVAIRERRANLERPRSVRLRRKLHQTISRMKLAIPGGVKRSRDNEETLFWLDTNARKVEHQLTALHIGAVFCLTPFLVDEEMTVRVASWLGIPTSAAILSFDNLTSRPWMPVTFDQYLLWNRHNAEQLRRGYPETAQREVAIVGSPQFDFYWKPEYLWSEQEWRSRLNLPPERPILLFAGGYLTCAPHEPLFLGQLDDAIEAGEIPGHPLILFRRHPVDPIDRWKPVLDKAKHVFVDNPWELGAKILGHTNIGSDDIRKLASTLYHTSVHINVASTMTIDGAIFDKPQVGPAYDDSPSRKYRHSAWECYLQEHYLPIALSGGLAIARNKADFIRSVREGLEKPQLLQEGRQRIVNEICTFNDGKCTQRVFEAVRSFVKSAVPSPAVHALSDPSGSGR